MIRAITLIESLFDSVESRRENESLTPSRVYKGQRMTILSTDRIGNIDICMSELDALANIDFERRVVKEELRELTIVRLAHPGRSR